MHMFIFKSEASRGLRAFSDDQGGQKLPAQFRPWYAVGVVRSDAAPPHNFDRAAIETAITDNGYQLWRMKSEKK